MPPSNDTDLAFASIEEIARLFRKRKLSPVELTKILLARIERLNPKLNAFLTVTPDLALSQAKAAESELFAPRGCKAPRDRGTLHGIPISLKDNICTKGIRTTAGSKILENFIPQQDAAVVSQLKQAGAVLLGKTNMHEFAYGVTSNNPHYGPVRNPWNLGRIPGGSSGGSAAAVAAGLGYGSIGTDTGGSIRIPSALCGIVGIKPGLGRVSVEHVIPLSPTLDFVGPLGRTVRDAALLLDPIFTKSKRVSGFALANPELKKERLLSPKPSRRRRFRLGIPKEFFLDLNSLGVEYAFREALRLLQKHSVKLCEVSIPLLNDTEDAGNQIAWAEATHVHQQAGWYPSRARDYGEDVRTRLETGEKILATAYLAALDLRQKFIHKFHHALKNAQVDALAVPATPIAAPSIGEEKSRINNQAHSTRALLLRNNRPANLAGVPAITLPCGFTDENLPVGLQLIAAVIGEPLLLQMAAQFESEFALARRPAL